MPRCRSTDGARRRKVEQFALRYLRANGEAMADGEVVASGGVLRGVK
jgi:hypothetical protein